MNTRKLKFSRSFRSDLFFPLFLTVCILGLIFLSVPSGSMFGSEVDWLCQHVVIADYMRKQFLSSGSLVPDYMHLGGGGSFFNISYYGFLRPDVLLSCFLPHISTAVILQIYAIAEILAGTWLLYFWLRRKPHPGFLLFCRLLPVRMFRLYVSGPQTDHVCKLSAFSAPYIFCSR